MNPPLSPADLSHAELMEVLTSCIECHRDISLHIDGVCPPREPTIIERAKARLFADKARLGRRYGKR